MVEIFIYLIAIVILFYLSKIALAKLNATMNTNYIQVRTKTSKVFIDQLYEICQSYSELENLIVEDSIKFSKGSINNQRFCLPIFAGNFMDGEKINENKLKMFCDELTTLIFRDMTNNISSRLVKYILPQIVDKPNSDIIIGYDGIENNFKIYIDDGFEKIMCLEFNLNNKGLKEKTYNKLISSNHDEVFLNLDNQSKNLIDSLKLCLLNCRIVYKVGTGTYHVILKNNYRLSNGQIGVILKYFNIGKTISNWHTRIVNDDSDVNVISIKKNGKDIEYLSIYFRPSNWISKLNRYLPTFNLLN